MTTPLKNDCLLRAIRKEPIEYTPVWIMRQAGRYLPEYRKTRQNAGDFLTLCKTPELACEVTLQPIARFPLDAAIIFSDILTIPDAMGLGLYFEEGEGPRFKNPITQEIDIKKIGIPDPMVELKYVCDAIQLTKNALDQKIPLIGFSGSPWTLATYMIEGGSSKQFTTIKKMMYESPRMLHVLLEKLAESVTLYLQAQITSGVDVVMLFDTWGGVLTTAAYQTFSLAYMQKIIHVVKQSFPNIPIILFTKQGQQWLEHMADVKPDVVGLDWTIDLDQARKRIGERVALQGNLDPSILYASSAVIEAEVKQVLAQYGKGSGHIFNLGHGIHPEIEPEKVAVLVNAVHEYSRFYHRVL